MKAVLIITIMLLLGCASKNTNNSQITNIKKLHETASNAYDEKNWPLSYELYKKLKSFNDVDCDYNFKLGVSAVHLGKIDEAEKYFSDVVKVNKNNTKATYNLAIIHLNKTNYYIMKYIETTPPNERDPNLIKLAVLFDAYVK